PYSPGGYQLGKKQNEPSVTVMKNYYRPVDYIYSFNPSTKNPVLLSDVPIERVLSVENDGMWVITAGTGRKLCRISKTGNVDEVAAVDDHWVAPEIHYHVSPRRKYLALALLHDEHDF